MEDFGVALNGMKYIGYLGQRFSKDIIDLFHYIDWFKVNGKELCLY